MGKFIWLLSVIILLTSCDKNLDVDLAFEGPRIALYCLMTPDSVWSVRLSETIPPTGVQGFPRRITNAEVVVFEDGLAIDTLQHVENGTYRSTLRNRPQSMHSYYLTAKAAGFPNVQTSTEQLPDQVTTGNFEFTESIKSVFNAGEAAKKLSLTVQQTTSIRNLYSVQVLGYYKGYNSSINIFGINRPDDVEDVCGFRTTSNTFVLRSDCFQDNQYTIQLGIGLTGTVQALLQTPTPIIGKPPADRIICYVRTLSDSYYRYLKSYYQPAGFETIFNQPQNVFSNVKGGYGIFAAYQEKAIVLL